MHAKTLKTIALSMVAMVCLVGLASAASNRAETVFNRFDFDRIGGGDARYFGSFTVAYRHDNKSVQRAVKRKCRRGHRVEINIQSGDQVDVVAQTRTNRRGKFSVVGDAPQSGDRVGVAVGPTKIQVRGNRVRCSGSSNALDVP